MKKTIILVVAFILFCFSTTTAMAEQYVMNETFTSMTPIFMVGHEGDATKIEGFEYNAVLTMGGNTVGSSAVRVTLLAPPLNLTTPVAWMNTETTYTFDGLGSIETHGMALGFAGENAAVTGDVITAGAFSVRNGTGALAGTEGVQSYVGSANVFTLTGNGTVTFSVNR